MPACLTVTEDVNKKREELDKAGCRLLSAIDELKEKEELQSWLESRPSTTEEKVTSDLDLDAYLEALDCFEPQLKLATSLCNSKYSVASRKRLEHKIIANRKLAESEKAARIAAAGGETISAGGGGMGIGGILAIVLSIIGFLLLILCIWAYKSKTNNDTAGNG
jgi:hypothetical protein